jgi:hypothetical protein
MLECQPFIIIIIKKSLDTLPIKTYRHTSNFVNYITTFLVYRIETLILIGRCQACIFLIHLGFNDSERCAIGLATRLNAPVSVVMSKYH